MAMENSSSATGVRGAGRASALLPSASSAPPLQSTTLLPALPLHEQQQQQSSSSTSRKIPPRLGLAHVSSMRVMALQRRQRARKERQLRRNAVLSPTPEHLHEGGSGSGDGAVATETQSTLERMRATQTQRQPIGAFETLDVTWSAVVEGEIETFMYPSLRLEALYEPQTSGGASGDASARASAARATAATVAEQSQHRHVLLKSSRRTMRDAADASATATPPAETVDAVMAPRATLDWTLAKRYQNPSQSAPLNTHSRLSESEHKRLQFDQQLEMAECMLRKREQLAAELKRELQPIGGGTSSSSSGAAPTSELDTGNHTQQQSPQQQQSAVELSSDDAAQDLIVRQRAASLYHPSLAHEPTRIPRLPQTRKIIKEIQRHTTSEGQIKYYADKQNLFAKWKKLQTSQQQQQAAPSRRYRIDEDSDSNDATGRSYGEDEEEDETLRPFGALSPRSLFFHECVKRQVLPEPVFSRIHDVKNQSLASGAGMRLSVAAAGGTMATTTGRQVPAADAMTSPLSFTHVAATLIRAVHDMYASGEHDGLVTTASGKVVAKKHHLALHLQHFGLGDAKTNALSRSLEAFPSIHVLDLSDNRLTDAAILPLLQSLETASLRPTSAAAATRGSSGSGTSGTSGIGTGSKFSSIVGRIGSANGSSSTSTRRKGNELRTLNLSHNAVGTPGCAQIARFLGVCALLTHLDLSHTGVGSNETLAPLTTAIEGHATLQCVNLSYNRIGERGGVLLGDMLTQPTCGITALDVSWNEICRSGATAIGAALRTNMALRSLDVAMNRCSDDGGEQLAAAMAVNASLTHLDLSRNAIGGRTAVAFAFFLRQNASLQTLALQDNALGAVGTRALLRAVASGSPCEIQLSVHDVAAPHASDGARAVFDCALPALTSPFELRVGASPYDFAVASLLFEAALGHRRCALSDLVFVDGDETAVVTNGKAVRRVPLAVDTDASAVVELPSRKLWSVPTHGVVFAHAHFVPPPMPQRDSLDGVVPLTEAACCALVRSVKRGLSSRETLLLLDLVLSDVYLSYERASWFVAQLRGVASVVDIVGRLWPCLVDGDRVFAFLRAHLSAAEQRRLVDVCGASTVQFTAANPTGRWTLDLSDWRQRKLALWFAALNAHEAAHALQWHAKRSDSSQHGRGYRWRNVRFNRRAMELTYAFFQTLPRVGVLEFDFVSTLRHEDAVQMASESETGTAMTETMTTAAPPPHELSDVELDELMRSVGAEVCAIYIPLPKRKDLKYQLVLFHLAIAGRFVTCAQGHAVLQHFPKTYEPCRLQLFVSLHRSLIDLEHVGALLERLTSSDRRRVYDALGYLNVVSPLAVDMDYEVDFGHDDEKLLLRALVDLSMASPLDLIRIESERSDVLVIYSMYQTNAVPASGKIYFRYVSHLLGSRSEWVKARQSLFRHFLCGERLKRLSESALVALGMTSATAGGGRGNSRGSVSVASASTRSARSSVAAAAPRPASATIEE